MPRPFSTLPTELVDLIAAHTCRPELLVLGRTDRRVHTVCLRQIYRDISLSDVRAVVLFFRTVISNKLVASYVLKFAIESWLLGLFKAFGALMRTGMSKLTALSELESVTPHIFHLFSDMYFPHLRDCTIPLSRDTAGFLQLHPKLLHLVVYNPFDLPVPASLSNPPIILPDLATFMGPHTVASLLLPGSQTELATITYHRHDTGTFADTLSPIGAAVPTLRALFSIVSSWDPALPDEIAAHLPSLSTVKIRNRAQLISADALPSFFLSIDTMVHALRNLITLDILVTPSYPLDNRAMEFEHVRRWGGISPSLTLVLLPSGTRWVRLPVHNIWLPTESEGATDWFVKEVIRPTTTLPPAYLEALQTLSGTEVIAKLQANYDFLDTAA
ncbi:hypothetical protein C8R46DRAFT_1124110 [Mycena filopes]|nr:hypothetical protein C8R46DRAFT_1124110 [Mycena filopes]